MVYDQSVDTSAVHAPVQANVVIRSQAQQIPLKSKQSTQNKETKPKNVMSYNGQRIDIGKMTQFLQGITRQTSTKKCARSVRLALQAGGAKFASHPVAAADWGKTLTQIGYRKINLSFDRPQAGDIYIIDRNAASRYGHIAAYTGSNWVSDYKQRSHAVYRNTNVTYTYYRLGGNS